MCLASRTGDRAMAVKAADDFWNSSNDRYYFVDGIALTKGDYAICQLGEAMKMLDESLKHRPEDYVLLVARAKIKVIYGNRNGAIKDLRRAQELLRQGKTAGRFGPTQNFIDDLIERVQTTSVLEEKP